MKKKGRRAEEWNFLFCGVLCKLYFNGWSSVWGTDHPCLTLSITITSVQHTFFLVLKVNFPPVSSKLLVRNQPRSTWSLRNTHHFLCELFFSEHHLRAESKLSTNTGGQPVVVLIGNRTLKLWFSPKCFCPTSITPVSAVRQKD